MHGYYSTHLFCFLAGFVHDEHMMKATSTTTTMTILLANARVLCLWRDEILCCYCCSFPIVFYLLFLPSVLSALQVQRQQHSTPHIFLFPISPLYQLVSRRTMTMHQQKRMLLCSSSGIYTYYYSSSVKKKMCMLCSYNYQHTAAPYHTYYFATFQMPSLFYVSKRVLKSHSFSSRGRGIYRWWCTTCATLNIIHRYHYRCSWSSPLCVCE